LITPPIATPIGRQDMLSLEAVNTGKG